VEKIILAIDAPSLAATERHLVADPGYQIIAAGLDLALQVPSEIERARVSVEKPQPVNGFVNLVHNSGELTSMNQHHALKQQKAVLCELQEAHP
jgi:hypothetical protein